MLNTILNKLEETLCLMDNNATRSGSSNIEINLLIKLININIEWFFLNNGENKKTQEEISQYFLPGYNPCWRNKQMRIFGIWPSLFSAQYKAWVKTMATVNSFPYTELYRKATNQQDNGLDIANSILLPDNKYGQLCYKFSNNRVSKKNDRQIILNKHPLSTVYLWRSLKKLSKNELIFPKIFRYKASSSISGMPPNIKTKRFIKINPDLFLLLSRKTNEWKTMVMEFNSLQND